MADTYETFAELAAVETEGVDYRIVVADRSSAIAIVAPHGGKIEPGSSEIALAIAGRDLSFYLFEGIAPRDNGRLHITSTHFDEPRALALVSGCELAVGIHGRADGDDPARVWVGGRARMVRNDVTMALVAAGFPAIAEGHALPGEDASNICNRGRCGAGVQLEIPRTLRERLREDDAALSRFAQAIRPTVAAC